MKRDRLDHGGDICEKPRKRKFAVPRVQPEFRRHHHLLELEEQGNRRDPVSGGCVVSVAVHGLSQDRFRAVVVAGRFYVITNAFRRGLAPG